MKDCTLSEVPLATNARATPQMTAGTVDKTHFFVTGVLTKLEIVNPHSWWYLDVKYDKGNVTHWRLESVSPAGLIRQGLKVKTDLKLGEAYKFSVAPSWKDPADGGKLAHMLSIFVDGKEYVLSEI